ncbi:UDP-N-acetylmuramyl tripeptide synthase [Lactobacillus selangorensis]|uniref:Lipid II isoglutaminyl synthase (glutamine-hydrolyzing) subunit MurT n=1 Tax=Lactobacillus selangorensis TaxID=81857 RepID=A0A0R2GA59_9LACO|nr:Mur ligase family protein [Lactobacillus selangorensis]KRN29301.1 UDP-N-acetylmuramyl tripeptide synthase [Lactobacillus selangorensis]KRN34170.1 UDP-N-acetylmuramyl tripeptide synthase [Lactobacillus selangorensis]
MTIRSSFAETVGKSSYWFLHTFMKGGSSFPGRIAEQIDPAVLKDLGRNYDVILVTGTNGKTLTTSLIVKVLAQKYDQILTNPSGSNMTQGIITAFLTDKEKPKRHQRKLAVLEVDEANVKLVSRYVKPKAFVLTNIFRDQLDRYGEIYTTNDKILEGIKLAPNATVIANGDEALFASEKLPNPVIYFGFDDQPDGDVVATPNTDGVLCPVCNHILHYKFITYSNLGKYFCPHCGFHRPALKYRVTKRIHMDPTSSQFCIDERPYAIQVGGLYNVYNALAAYSVGRFLGVKPAQIEKAFQYDEKVFGRQEVIQLGDKKLTLILVKNPVGLNQVLDMISTDAQPFSLGWLLNANFADGIDTSWIWDGNFEDFVRNNDVPAVVTGGDRVSDISFRLKIAGAPDDKIHPNQDLDHFIDELKQVPTDHLYVLANYTSMLQLRQKFADMKLVANRM